MLLRTTTPRAILWTAGNVLLALALFLLHEASEVPRASETLLPLAMIILNAVYFREITTRT